MMVKISFLNNIIVSYFMLFIWTGLSERYLRMALFAGYMEGIQRSCSR